MKSVYGITEPEIRQVPAPDEWIVAQLLAHVAEIQSFWMGKAVLIAQ
ncbi:MAG: DinB family protein [Dehalococcoidia bacterium]|nr:DinB family protein [Dehalococcoidia bacterium]